MQSTLDVELAAWTVQLAFELVCWSPLGKAQPSQGPIAAGQMMGLRAVPPVVSRTVMTLELAELLVQDRSSRSRNTPEPPAATSVVSAVLAVRVTTVGGVCGLAQIGNGRFGAIVPRPTATTLPLVNVAMRMRMWLGDPGA